MKLLCTQNSVQELSPACLCSLAIFSSNNNNHFRGQDILQPRIQILDPTKFEINEFEFLGPDFSGLQGVEQRKDR